MQLKKKAMKRKVTTKNPIVKVAKIMMKVKAMIMKMIYIIRMNFLRQIMTITIVVKNLTRKVRVMIKWKLYTLAEWES